MRLTPARLHKFNDGGFTISVCMFVIGTFNVYPIKTERHAKSNVSVNTRAQDWIKQAVTEVVVVGLS